MGVGDAVVEEREDGRDAKSQPCRHAMVVVRSGDGSGGLGSGRR